MISSPTAVLLTRSTVLAESDIDLIAHDDRRAVLVPHILVPNIADDGFRRAGQTAPPTPWTTLLVTQRGSLIRPGTGWPIAGAVGVPADLFKQVGGLDPRFCGPFGWIDLVERLRVLEPDLALIDIALTVPPVDQPIAERRADGFQYAANRSGAWRLTARCLRSDGVDARADSSQEPALRRVFPGG